MSKKNLLLFLNIIHLFIIFAPYGVYFIDNITFAKLVWMELVLIYLGWFLFDGKCIISEIEKNIIKKLDPNIKNDKMNSYDRNIINYYANKFLNIDGKSASNFITAFHWVSLYCMIYYTSRKINRKNEGISLILYSVIVYNFKEKLF
tara:strand:+ start:31 stop:471 length:441 start_codon:yes stop_codon:yes gene_type:complete